MTFANVAIMVTILLVVMVASMLYYGSRGKKKIRLGFDALAEALGGSVEQKNRMHYPHLKTSFEGRPVECFFHLSEGHRKTSDIVYLVISTPVELPSASLAVKEGVFAAAEGKGSFNDVAGGYLEDVLPGRYVYGADEDYTKALCKDPAVAAAIATLERYPNIVLGPDAITIGKPYGGAPDLRLDRMSGDLGQLVALGQAVDAVASGAGKTAEAEVAKPSA
ncbi:MAG: hypothetical protein ACE5FN_02400 [Leptospirillia bacterium]